MMLDWLVPTLISVFLVLAGIGSVRRMNMWRAGQAEKVDMLAGLLAMPKRYLHDLHHVVDRDKYISRTHVATGGGFVLAMVLVKKLGPERGSQKRLYALFPKGPSYQGCLIAGLPIPRDCLDMPG